MIDLIIIPVILAAVAVFLLSFICTLLSFGRSEDLRQQMEKLIYEQFPDIPVGKIPRLRAVSKLDLSCDYAFEYAEFKGLLANNPELRSDYWRLRSFRAKSLAGTMVGFGLLFFPTLF